MSDNGHTTPNNGHTTPDEAEAYARGYARAQRNHDRANRIAAFAAIRRAAELAREYDRAAFDANGRRPEVYDDCVFAANTIREAIRTALESPKA